ncbi:MAG: hypothetical protein DSY32_04190, partial [Aquifex sp.]
YVKLSFTHNVTNRMWITLQFSGNKYYATDYTYLGKGFTGYGELTYKLRVGYPDYTFRVYAYGGDFKEEKSKGIISKLSPYPDFVALPEDFFGLGSGFSFGYENRDSYTRVWRPFMNVDLGYNTVGGFLGGFSAGIGGALFGQDNLAVEINLTRNTGGVEETQVNIKGIYKRWF